MIRKLRDTAFVAGASLLLFTWFAPSYGIIPPLEVQNTSDSVPRGFYMYTTKWPPAVGDIVWVRDPPGFHLNWMLKRVVAVGGDRFCWHAVEHRHYVNDTPLPPIPQEAIDRKFPIWMDCRVLATDEVAGLGDHRLAYGSQYYGPLPLSRLWGVYRMMF